MDDNQRQNWWPDTGASQDGKDSADREPSSDTSGSAAQNEAGVPSSAPAQNDPGTDSASAQPGAEPASDSSRTESGSDTADNAPYPGNSVGDPYSGNSDSNPYSGDASGSGSYSGGTSGSASHSDGNPDSGSYSGGTSGSGPYSGGTSGSGPYPGGTSGSAQYGGYGGPAGSGQNNWQSSGFQGNYYYGGQNYQTPRRTASGFSVASLVMGIISLLLVCCGISYVFGALGIVFAILSRTAGKKMDSQASIGLGLSIAGSVIGIIVLIVYFVGNFAFISNTIQNLEDYPQFYGSEGYEDYFDDYFDDYGSYGNYGHNGHSFDNYFGHYGDDMMWDSGFTEGTQPLGTASADFAAALTADPKV